MKKLYTLAFLTIVFFSFSSCQQELHFPEPESASAFTVVMDGVQYNLSIQKQVTTIGDSAHVEIYGFDPQISVRLVAKSDEHNGGIGNYFLWCCNNDVFERTTGSQFHYEAERSGVGNNKQRGFVKVTRWDEKIIEGTYSITAKAGTGSNAPRKEFTGTFSLVL